MRVRVDRDRCVGNGVCEVLAESLFMVGDDGQAEVLVDEIPGDAEGLAREAADCCPALALVIDE